MAPSLLAPNLLAPNLVAQSLVIPSAAAFADGNSSTGYPFDVANGRLLYIYDSSHFTGNGINYPIVITEIKYRANAITTTWAGSTATLQMDLSTAPVNFTQITTTWDSNHGLDRAVVYNGPWAIPAGSSTAGVPGPFYASVPFSQPFLYDPSLGDLVIDTVHTGIVIANTPTLDAVTTAGVANATRIYSLTSPPAAIATAWSGELANVMEFTFTPASGLYAGFGANVTSGNSPLTVSFNDSSFSSAPTGITSWAWDFDGDNIVDSTLQNPTFVYTACGTYDVRLTVTDGVHPPSTLTKQAYISTDLISADFSFALLAAPNVFQFTDLTTPAATAWAWDFDGDGITDSTAQNPVWVLPNCQGANIRLTATRSCRSSSVTKSAFVAPNSLGTLFAANNGGSAGWVVMFDIDVTNPRGINLCGFDHNCGATALGTPYTVDVYVAPGTHVGRDNNIAEWRLMTNGSGFAAGDNVPSPTALSQALYLPFGSHGLALHYQGTSVRYTNGPLGPYSNSDLTLTLGSVRSTLFNGGSFFNPRVWNGRVYYDTATTGGSAGYGFLGYGCPGALGIPRLSGSRPVLGGNLSIQASNLPQSLAIMMTGFSNTISAFGFLPLDLGLYGAPGCAGRVSPDATSFLIGTGNVANFGFAIPNAPGLAGLQMYHQALVLDPGRNALGAVVSDAAAIQLGM